VIERPLFAPSTFGASVDGRIAVGCITVIGWLGGRADGSIAGGCMTDIGAVGGSVDGNIAGGCVTVIDEPGPSDEFKVNGKFVGTIVRGCVTEIGAEVPVGTGVTGNIAGGLVAETQFAWLKISIMAVREDTRDQGIGSALLLAAEAEAQQRGCRYAFVDTMDYQAPAFYERLGYRIVGQIPDWDSHGHAKIYLTKTLTQILA
jgi:GNAT superfamily N-acetyltransferase